MMRVLSLLLPSRTPRSFGSLLPVILVSGLLAGCAGQGVVSEQPLAETAEPYSLDSGDQLRVLVFGQEEMSGEYAVDGSGYISIPLMQPVLARGKSTQSLEAEISQILSQTLLRDPKVNVEILAYRPFFILGEVNNSGQYPFVSGMTVQTAVAIAGGYTFRGAEDTALITRKDGNRIIELRVRSSAAVRPGDTILIEERYF